MAFQEVKYINRGTFLQLHTGLVKKVKFQTLAAYLTMRA